MEYTDLTTKGQRDGLYGVYVGVVSDNEDDEGMGRVKVEFPWRDADDESNWARIATTMAGEEMGTYFLPEVGDEVLVAFEGGDIHYPYVVGSLWNGEEAPPETNDGENNVRMIHSRAGHKVTLDDEDGAGGVTVETAEGHIVDLNDEDEALEIADTEGNTVTMDGDGITLDSGGDVTISAENITLDADMDIEIAADVGVDIAGDAEANISGGMIAIASDGMFEIESAGMLAVESSAILQIEGALVTIN